MRLCMAINFLSFFIRNICMKKRFVFLFVGLFLLPAAGFAQTPGTAQPAQPADEVTQLRQAVQQLYQYVQYLDGQVRQMQQFIDAAVEIRLSFDIKDRPTKGKDNAPVALLEFSDYQCPYCANFANQVSPTLNKLLEEGKLKKVFMDMPLTSIHPQAFAASEAGWCAQEQGKYWQMHETMFKNQNKLGDLKALAQEAGLDVAKFETCASGTKYDAIINETMRIAERASIRSTPTLVLGYTQPNGQVKVAKILRGAGGNFVDEINALIEKAPKG